MSDEGREMEEVANVPRKGEVQGTGQAEEGGNDANEGQGEGEEGQDAEAYENDVMAELRARMSSANGRNSGTHGADKDLGGLVDDEGNDLRQEKDTHDVRRKGQWRGLERSGEAGLYFDYALETFDYKIQASILGSDLRVFVVFVVAFCFFFLVGRDINQNHYFAKAVKDPLLGSEIAQLKVEKYFVDISEAYEFNLWVLDVFLYQTIDLDYPTGGNFFLGSTRYRTQRVRKDTCTINYDIIPPSMPGSALECYGEYEILNADTGETTSAYNQVGRWEYKSCESIGMGTRTTGIIATYDCGGYMFEVPWWRPVDRSSPDSLANAQMMPFPSEEYERMPKNIAEKLYVEPALLNNPPFVDNLATRFVVLETFLYQSTLGSFLSIKVYCEQAAGGLWVPNYQVRVFNVWTNDDIAKTVFDGFFLLFILFYVYNFIADLLEFRRREKKTLAFFFNLWNIMEFLNLWIFVVVFGFRIAWIVDSIQADIKIDELTYTQKYPVILDDILNNYMFQVYLNSVNTVLTFLKLLKFFRLNDRLNFLTRTLSEAQDSIIGVLFIFLLVVTAFAMTGHGLFGLGVWKFRSVDASFSTLLQMLLGEFDYLEMKNENRVLAGLFFWSYIILALFCLLNFLIGVLMEAFAEVSATRTILPLDSVLVKTFADLKKVLAPANIKRYFSNLIQRTTKERLMSEGIERLKEFRQECYPADGLDIPDEDKQMIYKTMFYDGIGEKLVEQIGEDYLSYVWDDLVYEWDQSKSAEEAIKSKRNLEMTTKGVKMAIGKQLERIEKFSDRMQHLEDQLGKLAENLES